jgi:hypothetical protein
MEPCPASFNPQQGPSKQLVQHPHGSSNLWATAKATHRQIGLVANEHDSHIGVGMLPRILQPACQVVEGFPTRDVIDQQGTSSTPVIRPRDGPKGLLPRLQQSQANRHKG